jgi:hypothetical protein
MLLSGISEADTRIEVAARFWYLGGPNAHFVVRFIIC